jgi:uncharacterized protein (TIGR04255 family)
MEATAPNIATPVTFETPPVIEVVLSIQFEDDLLDDRATLADFWPRITERFPNVAPHLSLPKMGEDFDWPPPPPRIEVRSGPEREPTRYWFVSQDENELVQVQPDRLTLNWRKVRPEDSYPRYANLRPLYLEVVAHLAAVAEAQGRVVSPEWCEVTYINQIPTLGSGQRRPALHNVLGFLGHMTPHEGRAESEDAQLAQRFLLSDAEDRQPRGRLYFQAAPGYRGDDDSAIYAITLTARGRPAGEGLEGAFRFFDMAREMIVTTFRDATTSEMHELWGLVGGGEAS